MYPPLSSPPVGTDSLKSDNFSLQNRRQLIQEKIKLSIKQKIAKGECQINSHS